MDAAAATKLEEKINYLASLKLKVDFKLEKAVCINTSTHPLIQELALALRPWRKGPFLINDIYIDSEWQSFVKFDLLRPYLKLIKDKEIADVGCNNGYYMFKLLEFGPSKITGFDPSLLFYLQFRFINALAKKDIIYQSLGVEQLPKDSFDVIFALGILYHRKDPLKTLKELKKGLRKDGILFLDSLYIEDEREIALIPRKTYAKMSNIYYIPSILALRNWCERAGFKDFKLIARKKTSLSEQRKSIWIKGQSLEDFLDLDEAFSIEGYPAPRRVYIKVRG